MEDSRILNTRLFIIFCLLIFSANCLANDLKQIFKLAETADPQHQEVVANYHAVLESKPQARALLLPNINLSANTFDNEQDISIENALGASGELDFNSHGYSLDIRQPIFRYDRYQALKLADTQILQAQAEVDASLQNLIVRVAEAYFFVLGFTDNLEFARAEKKSLERQLEQATQRFEVGLTAITDVHEAQAGYHRAVADELLAINALDDAKEALREITGEYFQDLAALGDEIPLVNPEPNSIDTWTNAAIKQNLDIIGTRHRLETAQQEIKIQRAQHLPTLDLVANKSFNSTGGRFGGIQAHTTGIGLEFNMPIFEGGGVNSRVRQAQQEYNQVFEQLEQQRRAVQRQTREAFLGVISGISQVDAFRLALVSAETALSATEAGFEVGTRTAVDVVAAERSTLQAKRNYARSRYDYILNTLRLKQAAGTLSPDDLEEVNNWLKQH